MLCRSSDRGKIESWHQTLKNRISARESLSARGGAVRALSEQNRTAASHRTLPLAAGNTLLVAWLLPSRLPGPPLKLLDGIPPDQFLLTTPAEPVPPEPYGLVTDLDAAFMQKILDLAQRKRKPDIQHHREADDFR
jgi:hypothetical protein